jgi:phosphoribosyl-ATP pyrophosphohydrolase/phosphoribosyl-AMP cyclohydrolase/histidinol dehydrogenase
MPEAAGMPRLRILHPAKIESEDFAPVEDTARRQAMMMIEDVKKHGESGLLKHAWRFGELEDGSTKYLLDRDELRAAFNSLPTEQQGVLERSAARVRKFAQAQRDSIKSFEVTVAGGSACQVVEPHRRAGCYAPGGRYPLPSSVLMTACTARVAGVHEVIVASPRPTVVTKAAAYAADADCLLAVGGAHAIAALAHGVGVGPCDIIVGPGNKWVTAAKSIVSSGTCLIDMLAGPSEVLVVADDSCKPDVVAADLLAQAEHDVEARPILVTPSAQVIEKVNNVLQEQLAVLPTRDVAIPAVRKGFAVLTSDMDEAVSVTNRLGPEHLEVHTKKSQEVANQLTSYGGLFIGENAAEALGDYCAGPNHVLPTSCTAKYTGGLSVHTFLKKLSRVTIDDTASAQQEIDDAFALAEIEGMTGARKGRFHFVPSILENGSKRQRVS